MLQCTDDVLSAYLMVVVFKCNEEWGVGNRGIGRFVQIHLPFVEPLLQHLQITILQRSGVTGQGSQVKVQPMAMNVLCTVSNQRLGLVSSPDPTLSRGETVW